jgi:hypothetical protein
LSDPEAESRLFLRPSRVDCSFIGGIVFPNFRALPWAKIRPLALFTLCAAVVLSLGLLMMQTGAHGLHRLLAPVYAAQDAPRTLSPISIDYPEDGSIFPPGITPPTFLWRDAAGTSWSIDIDLCRQVSGNPRCWQRESGCTLAPSIRIASPTPITAQADFAAGRDLDMDSGRGYLGGHPVAFRLRAAGDGGHYRLSRWPRRFSQAHSDSQRRATRWVRRSFTAMFR